MNKIAVAKIIARTVVGSGTSVVTKAIIDNNVQPANLLQKVSIGVTTVVIGSMASQATKAHTDTKIDEFVAMFDSAKTELKDTTANEA